MKKALFIGLLITVGIIIYCCGSKNTNNTGNTTDSTNTKSGEVSNTGNNGPATGTINASGTISFKADGVSYSCPISKVIAAPTSITIQTLTTDIRNTGSAVVTCYTAASAITTGTYTAASPATISSVTFIDKKVIPYSATAATSGSSCAVNITTLTSTSIKGTFTATVLKPIDNTKISITEGVIDCSITSK
jgi:hypothetical protein